MKLSDFNYELPPDLIARYPLDQRSASRLLCLDAKSGRIEHQKFSDILSLIKTGDLLVCNNTRVIPARLFGKKATGGAVEVLVERILDDHRILAQVRASKSLKSGSILFFAEGITLEVIGRRDNLYELKIPELKTPKLKIPPNPPFPKGGRGDFSILNIIEKIGEIPLPPYFHRSPEESDKERYQTIFAKYKGSVAAPTAGLHFDIETMNQLQAKGVDVDYVTLHIGSGTFAPVRVEEIENHRMHSEYLEVSAALCEKIQKTKLNGGRVIAVGTTSLRSLETASLSGTLQPFSGYTDIFIYPGFQFKCVDALITNLHLPGSTLLMLVAALGGYKNIMEAYRQAVQEKYRFFSYGDAMWIG